ncbi:hypothetical protein ERJ75_000419300 [Trypanosoma vivax]|uniref:Uncharacterized protein n=1 Tax=Trypanosoma vivax (strain Y486) TaxID=1055687 RepID=G0TZF6_TRYVY|nr:hypothetical protein TRVL_00253 [Trypanosoma vivax]KAH8617044.1 hypothetical protein ERJ75_000419300 [Trypanosoma vivax]CCC49359.1 conserved hypothetical protein [Trypanosoma vivax Y486]
MLKCSVARYRYRTAWRELLHPLPVRARQMEWLKRDAVEENEELLRRPYYTIKSFSLPPSIGRQNFIREGVPCGSGLKSSHSVDSVLEQPRRVKSPEELRALREKLKFPGAAGPMVGGAMSFEDAYGTRLRPRYPESWETVPPHQPSRGML